jgi:hypothetical protein
MVCSLKQLIHLNLGGGGPHAERGWACLQFCDVLILPRLLLANWIHQLCPCCLLLKRMNCKWLFCNGCPLPYYYVRATPAKRDSLSVTTLPRNKDTNSEMTSFGEEFFHGHPNLVVAAAS